MTKILKNIKIKRRIVETTERDFEVSAISEEVALEWAVKEIGHPDVREDYTTSRGECSTGKRINLVETFEIVK